MSNNTFYNNYLYTTLPAQKVPESEKNEDWGKRCVTAICSMGTNRMSNGRSTWSHKQVNYDLVNSIIDERDFELVLNPYGLREKPGAQPSKLRSLNVIASKINLLKGEEMLRPFKHFVMGVGGEVVNEKDQRKKEMMLEAVKNEIAKQLGISLEPQTDPQTGEQLPPPTFESVEKYSRHSLRDIREQWGNDILDYLSHKENIKMKFNEGWEHGLIAAEEIYYVGISNGTVKLRTCNPLNCEFDRNPDNPWIQDGDWFKEDRWMSKGQIIDEYGDLLTSEQLDVLDKYGTKAGLTNQMFPGYGYNQEDVSYYGKSKFSNTHFLVSHVVWRSLKGVVFLSYPDENGEMQESVVDSTFKLTPELKAQGFKAEKRWIEDIWHGTKIGQDIYIGVEPLPNQVRSMDNPYHAPLPYVGRVYNSTNSFQTSFVDLIKPHQYLYIITWFRLEAEIAKAKGKKMVFDLAQLPRSEGFDLEKWMYFFDNVGLAVINSFEEGKGKFQGQTSNFNQFQAIDMTLSQSIQQYISIMDKIEDTINKIVGITPQREGAIHQSETVGGVQRAVANSSLITEPWFYIHNEVKREVLTQMLECSKFAFPKNKKVHNIIDGVEKVFVDLDMEKFSDSDYSVFVTDSTQEHNTFQKLEGLAQQALAAGAVSYSDIIKLYKAKSVGELSHLIEESEAKRQDQAQAQQQAQQQMQQQQIQAQAAEKQADRVFTAEQNQLDRETDIRRAVISATSFDTDTQGSGELEAIKYGELSLKQMDSMQKNQQESNKLSHDANERAKDRALKEKEIQSKEKIEELKAKVSLKNPVSGEKK
jgi:hypothetical protein